MPRQRANGAQKPYRIRRTRTVTLPDGRTEERVIYRWQAKIVVGHDAKGRPKYKTVSSNSYRDCDRKLKELRDKLNRGLPTSAETATFRDYVSLYLMDAATHVAPSTLGGYRTKLNKLLPAYGGMRMSEFTPTIIRSMLNVFADKSFSYRHVLYTALNQVFDMAAADQVIVVNPVKSVSLRKVRGESLQQKRRAYSVPELKSMLLATLDMPTETAARMWWRIFTGMRQGEICGCVLEDLHLDAPQPYYELNWSLAEIPFKHQCGEPTGGVYPCGKKYAAFCPNREYAIPEGFVMRPVQGHYCLKTPKSGKSRIVPLTGELVEIVRRYLEATQDWENPHGLLWHHEDGSPIMMWQDTADFKQMLIAAGLDPRERCGHETRYSAVTLMRKAGVDIKTVQEIIGHTSVDVDNLYRTVDMSERAQAVNMMDSMLKLPQGMLPSGQNV